MDADRLYRELERRRDAGEDCAPVIQELIDNFGCIPTDRMKGGTYLLANPLWMTDYFGGLNVQQHEIYVPEREDFETEEAYQEALRGTRRGFWETSWRKIT